MRINTYGNTVTDSAAALEGLITDIRADGDGVSFVFVAANANHDAVVFAGLGAALNGAACHVASSCLGAMSGAGPQVDAGHSLTAFVIRDGDGDYGTGAAQIGDDPQAAGRQAAERAVTAAGREGEAPDVIWITAAPGQEEAILEGVQQVVGQDVPLIGGSAADNEVAGGWFVATDGFAEGNGVVVTAMFPSTAVGYAYQNGYAPSAQTGIVTKVEGRNVIEIDGRPANQVYAEWTGAEASRAGTGEEQNILAASTLWPLGRKLGEIGGVANYLLAHPAVAHGDDTLGLFANLQEGEEITQMTGDAEALITRAGRVAAQAVRANDMADGGIAGGLMVYCGGCMLAIRDDLSRVAGGTREALNEAPFVGFFSFGEQGPVVGSGNRHGNLMISCITFAAS